MFGRRRMAWKMGMDLQKKTKKKGRIEILKAS